MFVTMMINHKKYCDEIEPSLLLIDYLRSKGFYSVKRGCETSNCGLCTVLMDDQPVLSCSLLCAKVDGHHITTLEGVEEEANEFAYFMANEGAEQCGFCSPGLVMNVIAMKREMKNPSEEEIKQYLAGNLCRCSGYMGQMRAIMKYLNKVGDAHETD